MRFILNSGAVIIENAEAADKLNIGVGGEAAEVDLAEFEHAIHFAKGEAERIAIHAGRERGRAIQQIADSLHISIEAATQRYERRRQEEA